MDESWDEYGSGWGRQLDNLTTPPRLYRCVYAHMSNHVNRDLCGHVFGRAYIGDGGPHPVLYIGDGGPNPVLYIGDEGNIQFYM